MSQELPQPKDGDVVLGGTSIDISTAYQSIVNVLYCYKSFPNSLIDINNGFFYLQR